MKKGICHACFAEGMPLDRRLDLAQQAGFDGYELIVRRPGETELHADSDAASLEALRQRITKRGLELCSMFGSPVTDPLPITSPDQGLWEQGVKALERMLEIANALEISTLLYVPGRVDQAIPYDVAYERALEALRLTAPRAQELGVYICLENVGNRFLQSPLEMRDFILAAGSEYVRAYFDVGNVLAFGYPEQWIRILGPRIRKVHIKDFRRGVGSLGGFVDLLSGDVDFPAVVAALAAAGYDDYLTAEMSPYRLYPDTILINTSSAMDRILGRTGWADKEV